MITLQKQGKKYDIDCDGRKIGTAELYENPCHRKNCYVRPELFQPDTEIAEELFRKLRECVNRPLQIMVNSCDTEMTEFLIAGGFVCKRKCYEVEAEKEDYIGGAADVPLARGTPKDPDYERCCRIMYRHYVKTHGAVNPWTADYAAFRRALPAETIYAKDGDNITGLAFVKDNEIAYVCGTDEHHFLQFARALVADRFEVYESIFFESDDCDWAAMILKSLFINQDDVSFDTFLLENEM